MQIPAKIAGEIELKLEDVPADVLAVVRSALTVRNEDRDKALSERVFGAWDMPEFIELYRDEARRGGERVICLPRGFAANLYAGVARMGHEIVWEDRRVSVAAKPGYFRPFVLRPYQLRAVTALLQAEQGFYACPAGGGKTVTELGLMAYAQQRTLIIVDKAGLVEQWRARAEEFLGLSRDFAQERSVGKIGEDVWEERDLTICLRQTLWSRVWELDATDWFDKWGFVLFDEGHHLASDTLGEICRRARAKLLQGTSATPAKTETKGTVVHSLVGPIVHQTTREELYEAGVLMKPHVEVVYTGHDDVFWDTHEVREEEECQVPNCKKAGQAHFHRNNYSSCVKRLVESKTRNAMIADRIVSERGHVHLVASRQLKHLDLLRKAVEDAGWDGPIYMLRGEENAQGLSQPIAEAVIAGGQWDMAAQAVDGEGPTEPEEWVQILPMGEYGREAVIFSSVADEALDIPPIDRVHIPFPMRQAAATIQLVGRGERISEGKEDAIIVDYTDRCSVFADQAQVRQSTYRYVGYEIKERHAGALV